MVQFLILHLCIHQTQFEDYLMPALCLVSLVLASSQPEHDNMQVSQYSNVLKYQFNNPNPRVSFKKLVYKSLQPANVVRFLTLCFISQRFPARTIAVIGPVLSGVPLCPVTILASTV